MANSILTEAGDKLIGETVPGFTNASSLNDALVAEIIKETFTTNPALSDWLIGSGWVWDNINGQMDPV